MAINEVAGLLLWGTLVGLDLASVAQIMITRPLVAGVVAGAIVGDVNAGLVVGVILELFALELLPFGAARYPDYGLGAVAAAATAAGAPGVFGLGIAVTVGLVVAYAGELSIQLVRRRTSVDVQKHRSSLDAGDVDTIYRLHLRGIGRDTVRSLALVAAGLLLAAGVQFVQPVTVLSAVGMMAAAIGIGLGTACVGGARVAASNTGGWVWLVIGLVAGTTWVVVW